MTEAPRDFSDLPVLCRIAEETQPLLAQLGVQPLVDQRTGERVYRLGDVYGAQRPAARQIQMTNQSTVTASQLGCEPARGDAPPMVSPADRRTSE